MGRLVNHIEGDSSLLIGKNHMQELCLSMHVVGVYSADILRRASSITGPFSSRGTVWSWPGMPSTVWVTVKVPRTALTLLTNRDPTELGMVPVNCTVRSSLAMTTVVGGWQNIFAAAQTGFRHFFTSDTRYTNDFKVSIADDLESWSGTACLFSSLMAPSWMLLQESDDAEVMFGVQTTPYTLEQLFLRLDIHMTVFKAKFGNTDHVYVLKNPPNERGNMVVGGLDKHDAKSLDTTSSACRMSLEAQLDSKSGTVCRLTSCLGIDSIALKQKLAGGASAQTAPLTLFNLFFGLQGAHKCSMFGLNHSDEGGTHILMFVSALSLDVTDRIVILDTAILPLWYDILPKLAQLLDALTTRSVRMIKVDVDELMLWKQFLPAYVERCRTWKHRT